MKTMNKDVAKRYLRMAFAALSPEQRALLREHAKAKTPIYCSSTAHKWERRNERDQIDRG